jgi:hypothetical protein
MEKEELKNVTSKLLSNLIIECSAAMVLGFKTSGFKKEEFEEKCKVFINLLEQLMIEQFII